MNESPIEISAVVISFNGMHFLPECLRTLAEDLKGMSHEIIIVDNGSSDGSVEFIRDNYLNAHLVENKTNVGFAKAVNEGIKAAKGKYLYILNQDLRFRKGTARTLLDRLKQDDTIGMIGPKYVGFDGRLQWSARAFPSYRHIFYRALFLDRLFPHHPEFSSWRMGWFDHEHERFVDQPMGAVMLIPREVIDRIGYMDEYFPLLFNDVDYCRRMKEAGYRLLYYPDAVVEHFVGGSTKEMPVKLRIASHRSLYRYLRKYARPAEYPLLWLSGLLLMVSLPPLLVHAMFKKSS